MKLNLSEISNLLSSDKEILLDRKVNKIKIDSRKILDGDVFVAVKGELFDGHDFVNQAFQNGAIAAIVEKKIGLDDDSHLVFEVENSLDAMQKVAEFYRSKFDIKVIGITGSVGKSTVKEMVASIFLTEFNVLRSYGNMNGQIGLPLSVFNLEDETQIAVFEMGISQVGEMKKLAKIARPDYAIINNIGTSHLGNFGSTDVTIKEKFDIASCSNCKIYANGDNPDLVNFLRYKDNIVYFGLGNRFPYSAENVISFEGKTEFVLVTDSYKENIKIPYFGIHNVYNALASVSLAADFGIHINDIKSGIMNSESLPMRQKVINLKKFTMVDDSYNASPDSVKASISLLKSLNSAGRNVIVMADILELGDYSRDIHFDLGKYISVSDIDVLITIGKWSEYINQGANSVDCKLVSKHFELNEDAYNYLYQTLEEGDKVLIKGSRGMKTDEIVKKILDHFGEDIEES